LYPWIIFALAGVAQFMVVLDSAVVNVALASIQRSLHFSQADLPWVLNIYVLMFGGFLLLGGRAGDLFGRRRLFMAGLVLFSLASLAGGLAQNAGWLVIARGVQGLGAAIISPISLAIVSDTFAEGAERNRALGIFGAITGVGAACGVLLGGVLTSSFGWPWVFFVNVPVGIAAAAISPLFIPESRPSGESRGFDLAGAVSVTAALLLLVYGIVKAPDNGWVSAQTLGYLGGTAALLAGFVMIELRSSAPLVRLGIFRLESQRVTNIAALITGAGMLAMFYFISLYLQLVLHYSALRTGLAYLPMALWLVLSAGIAGTLVTRLGYRSVLTAGLAVTAAGLAILIRVPVDGIYPLDILPASLIMSTGLGLTLVPLTIAAVQGVEQSETGLASGLMNTSLQIGGALGLAVLSTIATTRFNDLIKSSRGPNAFPSALVGGYHYAFIAGAILLALGAVLVFALLPNPGAATAEVEEESFVA
jgi:EmrB/QacA subfamily drug resistance transporter